MSNVPLNNNKKVEQYIKNKHINTVLKVSVEIYSFTDIHQSKLFFPLELVLNIVFDWVILIEME